MVFHTVFDHNFFSSIYIYHTFSRQYSSSSNKFKFVGVFWVREMERISILLIIAAASFLFMFNGVADALKKDSEVFQVGGKVLCQDCTEGWNEWVTGAKPIKGISLSFKSTYIHNRHVHGHVNDILNK